MERERERKRDGAVGFGGIEVAIMYVFKLRRFLFSVLYIENIRSYFFIIIDSMILCRVRF